MKSLRAGVVVMALSVAVVSGCGGQSGPVAGTAGPATSGGSRPAASVETSAVVPAAVCTFPGLEGRAALIQQAWKRVLATRGTGEHAKAVDQFTRQAESLSGDIFARATRPADYRPCATLPLGRVFLTSGHLSGKSSDEEYAHVADLGNAWLSELHLGGRVEPFPQPGA